MEVSIKVTMRGSVQGKVNELATKIGLSLQNAGIVTEGSAKQKCPVDTGRLRSSIKYTKVSQFAYKVGTNVKYAPPVEFGHVTRSGTHVPAHPFMFPGFLDGKRALMDDLKLLS